MNMIVSPSSNKDLKKENWLQNEKAEIDPLVEMYREFDKRTFGTSSAFQSTERYALQSRFALHDLALPLMTRQAN